MATRWLFLVLWLVLALAFGPTRASAHMTLGPESRVAASALDSHLASAPDRPRARTAEGFQPEVRRTRIGFVRFLDGPNLFLLLRNQPLSRVDPSGKIGIWAGMFIAGTLVYSVDRIVSITGATDDSAYWKPAIELASSYPYILEPKIDRVRLLRTLAPNCPSLIMQAVFRLLDPKAITYSGTNVVFRGPKMRTTLGTSLSGRLEGLTTLTHEAFHAFEGYTMLGETEVRRLNFFLWDDFYRRNPDLAQSPANSESHSFLEDSAAKTYPNGVKDLVAAIEARKEGAQQ